MNFLLFVLVFGALWAIGILDFLRESNFHDFKWPPYVNVREQVVRELLGRPSEFVYYNRWTDFQTLATPTCKKNWLTRKKSLLIVIKTGPERFEHRSAYRKTLSNVKQVNGFRLRVIFVSGTSSNLIEFKGSKLEEESFRHQDMLIGDFQDEYFNNTLKYLHSIKWTRWQCFPTLSLVPYLLLMDDDYMLNISNLIRLIERTTPNEQLYTGWRFDSSPFRLVFQKFQISIEEYPFNAYPPYIAGGCVLYSPQSVRELYIAVQHSKIFRFDDVYAGILAYNLGHEVRMNGNFLFTRDDSVSWTTKIAEHEWTSDQIERSFGLINLVKA